MGRCVEDEVPEAIVHHLVHLYNTKDLYNDILSLNGKGS